MKISIRVVDASRAVSDNVGVRQAREGLGFVVEDPARHVVGLARQEFDGDERPVTFVDSLADHRKGATTASHVQ